MGLWNFNWLFKPIEKIRSSQDFILTSSCTELNLSLRVSLKKLKTCNRGKSGNSLSTKEEVNLNSQNNTICYKKRLDVTAVMCYNN